MAFLRKKTNEIEDQAAPAPEPVIVEGVRSAGPWDSSERSAGDDPAYVDLGALQVRGRPGMEIRLQSDGNSDQAAAALVVVPDSALELRAFAGPKSSGQWDLVRADIIEEVQRLKGEVSEVEGELGTELRVKIPVTMEDGKAGFQPSRIIGVEGPRWLLRATLLGKSALEPSDDDVLVQTLRDVIVVRGDQAMVAREPLLLTPPDGAVVPGAEDEQ